MSHVGDLLGALNIERAAAEATASALRDERLYSGALTRQHTLDAELIEELRRQVRTLRSIAINSYETAAALERTLLLRGCGSPARVAAMERLRDELMASRDFEEATCTTATTAAQD